MFIITLRFSDNKAQAGQFMAGHNEWVKRGLDDGIFLLVGSIAPQEGGVVIAHNISHTKLLERVNEDPFVSEKIVTADIMEIIPAKADKHLQFLLETTPL